MNWKFWQRKPKAKADVFGPVEKWQPYPPYTPSPLALQQAAEEHVTPLPADPEPVVTTAVEPDTAITGVVVGKMDQGIKARWVEALRSGKYLQGKNDLRYRADHKKSEFCCLGVLCEIAVDDGVIFPPQRNAWGAYVYDEATKVPSRAVKDWAGISEFNPAVIGPDGGRTSLATLNDEAGLDFNAIADIIEAQL